MIVIRNKWIPFGNYDAINIFGILFCKEDAKLTPSLIRHESIHTAQIKELLYLIFYVWYCVEYLIKLCKYKTNKATYRKISFEQEAYRHEFDVNYLNTRKHYVWMSYI